MGTRLHHADDPEALVLALELLGQGESVIIPTETILGLTADAENSEAVARLYQVKQRAIDKVSAVFLPEAAAIGRFAKIEHVYTQRIIDHFLPGPLTVILKSRRFPWEGVVGADAKIGIRISSEPFVSQLARDFGRPLIATSANRAGASESLDVRSAYRQFEDSVSLIVYRHETVSQVASTVVDLTGAKPEIMRQGEITLGELMTIAAAVDRS